MDPVIERLGALDAEFLHVEDGVGHMHIAGACTFDGAPPAFEELERLVASKMHLIARYRKRVRSVQLDLARPIWVDDPHFDLRYHLRHTALPAPGDDEAHNLLLRTRQRLQLQGFRVSDPRNPTQIQHSSV